MSNQNRAHTCAECGIIQVTVPSQADISNARSCGVSVGQILRFVSIEGPKVLAGSSVCTFFAWAMTSFRRLYRDEDLDNTWSLNGGILLGHLEQYADFPFVGFQWWHNGENVIDTSTSWFAVLAEAGTVLHPQC